MNFLAHVYLSGSNDEIAIGNLIGDRVKGNKIKLLPKKIQSGVTFHKLIDHFTDHNQIFRECVTKLFPKYRHFSRVIIDMYFDHFLAKNWNYYHNLSLNKFSNEFYKKIIKIAPEFNQDIERFINALVKYNWFGHYKTTFGLYIVLKQMEKRTKFTSNFGASVKDLNQNYEYFEIRFFQFMNEIIKFTKTKIKDL